MPAITKLIIICTVALAILLFATRPSELPSVMLIVPFLLLYAMAVLSIAALLVKFKGFTLAKSLKIGVFCAALPTLLLAMQSVGQLAVRDVVTVFILFGVVYFYMSRLTRAGTG